MRGVREDVVVPPTLAAPSEDGRYVIPKGHTVLSSAAVSQIDPMLWKNANEWDPTRWSDPEGVAAQAYKQYDDANGAKVDFGFGLVSKGTDSPYQPFGAGRHRCIGEQFAYLQLGTLISTVIRQVELRLPETGVPPPNYHVCTNINSESTWILTSRLDHDHAPEEPTFHSLQAEELRLKSQGLHVTLDFDTRLEYGLITLHLMEFCVLAHNSWVPTSSRDVVALHSCSSKIQHTLPLSAYELK